MKLASLLVLALLVSVPAVPLAAAQQPVSGKFVREWTAPDSARKNQTLLLNETARGQAWFRTGVQFSDRFGCILGGTASIAVNLLPFAKWGGGSVSPAVVTITIPPGPKLSIPYWAANQTFDLAWDRKDVPPKPVVVYTMEAKKWSPTTCPDKFDESVLLNLTVTWPNAPAAAEKPPAKPMGDASAMLPSVPLAMTLGVLSLFVLLRRPLAKP